MRQFFRNPTSWRAGLVLVLACLLTSNAWSQGSFDELVTKAKSGRSFERARAVRSLAEMDRDEAWEVLLDLLGDPAGEAAGSAQWYLGTTKNEGIATELGGKRGLQSKDATVRWRAAEALGRVKLDVLTSQLLLVASKDKSAEVRAAAWRSLERRARRGVDVLGNDKGRSSNEKRLVKAATKEKDALARSWALAVHAFTQESEGTSVGLDLVASKSRELRVAAARVLVEDDPASPVVLELARDEHWAVRRAVLDGWADQPSKASVTRLAEHLGEESRARLVAYTVERLRALSGLRHGPDARPWKAWANELPADWSPTTAKSRPDPIEVSSSWKGFPILSDRLAILIDLSGSIREKRDDGKTRKEIIDGELRTALESLGEDTEFVLVGYHSKPLVWRDELVPATEKNVARARQWFEKINDSGPGNLWTALEAALALDPEIDTVLVLHDGAPTGDRLYRAELYRELFLDQNRIRGLFFDTILVDAGSWVRQRFTELAERSGGRATTRELLK